MPTTLISRFQNLPRQRKLLYLVLILVLFLICIVIVVVVVTNTNQNNSSATTNSSHSSTSTSSIPAFTTAGSETALPALSTEAIDWATDAKILSVSALGSSIQVGNDRNFYGYEDGKFMLWSISVYSPSRQALNTLYWRSGTISSGEDIVVDEFSAGGYELTPSIPIGSIPVSSTAAFQTAKLNGLDDQAHVYLAYLQLTPETNLLYWEFVERSKTELDEYGTGVTIMKYKIDATSGAFMEKV